MALLVSVEFHGASVFTTFLRNCGSSDSLGTTTCHKTAVGVSKGMLQVKYFCFYNDLLVSVEFHGASVSTRFLKNCGRGDGLGITTCLTTVVCVSKGMLHVRYFCSNNALTCVS